MAHDVIRPALLRTLALDPGTREMGYAILEGTELLYFGVHTFRHLASPQALLTEGQRYVTGLFTHYHPQLFVIERTSYVKSKRSALLHDFVSEMQLFAKRHELLVRTYAPTIVKKAITGNGAATKRQVAETLIEERYPYLTKYLQIDLRSKERYWENMFDAIALGLTGYHEVFRQEVRRRLKQTS